jgi:hypothetical protein
MKPEFNLPLSIKPLQKINIGIREVTQIICCSVDLTTYGLLEKCIHSLCFEILTWYLVYGCIIRDYYMIFSILALVLARDSHTKPDSEAGGLIWVEGWYQGRYGKFHVIIFLSHILHWPFPSIDFYIAKKDLWTDKLRK